MSLYKEITFLIKTITYVLQVSVLAPIQVNIMTSNYQLVSGVNRSEYADNSDNNVTGYSLQYKIQTYKAKEKTDNFIWKMG